MEGVKLGSIIGELLDKNGLIKINQISVILEFGKNPIGFGREKIGVAKRHGAVWLRNVDRAKFASKIIDVPEKLAMKV